MRKIMWQSASSWSFFIVSKFVLKLQIFTNVVECYKAEAVMKRQTDDANSWLMLIIRRCEPLITHR